MNELIEEFVSKREAALDSALSKYSTTFDLRIAALGNFKESHSGQTKTVVAAVASHTDGMGSKHAQIIGNTDNNHNNNDICAKRTAESVRKMADVTVGVNKINGEQLRSANALITDGMTQIKGNLYLLD